MIILDTTTRSLEIVLGAIVTTNQLPFISSYVDVTTTAYTPASNNGVSNNTTAVTVVAAPAASTPRQVKLLIVRNTDTAAATVTVRYNDNGTIRSIVSITLAVNDMMIYTDGEGWRVIDVNGQLKESGVTFATPAFVYGTANAAGAAATPVRSDATLAVFDTTVPVTQASADAAATGSAAFAARRDHRHGMPTIGAGGATLTRKTADESVNNSTTLQDDNTFTFSIAANEVWTVLLYLWVDAGSTPASDFKFTFTAPVGATGAYGASGYALGNTAASADVRIYGNAGIGGAGNQVGLNDFYTPMRVSAIIVNSTTAGTVTFQWAQGTARAYNTTIRANSYMARQSI